MMMHTIIIMCGILYLKDLLLSNDMFCKYIQRWEMVP